MYMYSLCLNELGYSQVKLRIRTVGLNVVLYTIYEPVLQLIFITYIDVYIYSSELDYIVIFVANLFRAQQAHDIVLYIHIYI